jgi:hypothetical protein
MSMQSPIATSRSEIVQVTPATAEWLGQLAAVLETVPALRAAAQGVA